VYIRRANLGHRFHANVFGVCNNSKQTKPINDADNGLVHHYSSGGRVRLRILLYIWSFASDGPGLFCHCTMEEWATKATDPRRDDGSRVRTALPPLMPRVEPLLLLAGIVVVWR
jgi:hypothetical protein